MIEIDTIMKKVFKREFAILDESRRLLESPVPSKEKLEEGYVHLLESYELLLKEVVKITKIGDINQKKLFDSHEELERQKQILYRVSITDPLTNIYNRAYLMDALKAEFAKNKRYQLPFSCMLIDIDDFKQINDNYGHLMGDIVLQETSRIIKANLREVDVFGRYGGEEFLIILPNIKIADATPVAEKIRTKIAQTRFDCAGDEISITLSLGLLDSTNSQLSTEDSLLHNVDTALYEAKKKGKNCYVIFQGT